MGEGQHSAGTPISRVGVMLLNECLDLVGGNYAAAVMLSQLIYWYTPSKTGQTRLRVERDGHLWVVKSYHDWYNECRLSRGQVNRAVALLKSRDLVATQIHGFKGRKATFIRLTDPSLVPEAMHDIVHFPPTQCTESCNAMHAIVHSNTKTTVQETTCTEKGGNMKINGGKPGQESEQVKNMLLSKSKAKKDLPLENLKKNATALSQYWREWLADRYPELKMLPPLNIKEQSQLVKLVQALGSNPLVLLRWAVFNWDAFKLRAELEHGKKIGSKYPHIGTLLLFRSSVATAHVASLQLIAPPLPLPVSHAVPMEVVVADKATAEDSLKAWKSLHE